MSQKALLIFILLLLSKLSFGQYVINKTASFNGINSYASVRNFTKLNLTTAIKLEAWIKPTSSARMMIAGKKRSTGYGFGLEAGGQPMFYKGFSFVTFTENPVPINEWTHLSFEYVPGTLKLYLNGVLANTFMLGGDIAVNSDSLRIGADVNSSDVLTDFFQGEIDDLRIWNRTFDEAWDRYYMTVPLAVSSPSGRYAGLVASYRMNGELNSLVPDEVLPVADARPRNITYTNYRNKIAGHNDYNNSIYFNGVDSYLADENEFAFNSTTAITLEAWVKRDTLGAQNSYMVLASKSGGTNRTDYTLALLAGSTVNFSINNGDRSLSYPSTELTNARWHHIAATYNNVTGNCRIYVDGVLGGSNFFSGNPAINNNTDSLYLGKRGGSMVSGSEFKGQLDEVRIWWNTERTAQQIKNGMYKNYDYTSPDGPTSLTETVVYGFDGKSYTSLLSMAVDVPDNGMKFRGGAEFVTASRVGFNSKGNSPMLRDDGNDFAGASYVMSSKRFFIPDNSPAGITDSVLVTQGGVFTGMKMFALINHQYIEDLSYINPGSGIILTNPMGTSVVLTPNYISGNGSDLMTIFDATADSTIRFNFYQGRLSAPFSPSVKPANSFAAFNGQPVMGWWKLKFVDRISEDAGYVSGWGLQIQTITGTGNETQIAGKYELSQNYPNPFNPSTKINYQIKNNGFVSLKVFDMLGKEVASLVNQNQTAGSYSIELNADRNFLSSGIYFYRLDAGEFKATKKMMLIK